jgi:glycosyltransferase involved in cell wall biosynthesis
MSKKILVGCYEPPGWGGASTGLYLLFQKMQQDGFDVAYVSLIAKKDKAFFQHLFGNDFGNPLARDNVYSCMLEEPRSQRPAALVDLVARLSPHLLVGKGFIAARLMKLAAPHLPLVFVTAGSRQVQHLIETGTVTDFIAFRRSIECGVVFTASHTDHEAQATEASDLIVVNSPLVRFAFEHFFPAHANKIYSKIVSVADLVYREADRFEYLKRPFAHRDIDVIFIASKWNRVEKNYGLVRKIIARGLNVHVVGQVDQPCPPAHYHGVVTRRHDLYELLGRSKVLVCPSLIDAEPGVLFQASAMDCNVVASPNCGARQLCNTQLLADQCSLNAFLSKIHLSLSKSLQDNRECFRGGYENLVEALNVF